MKMRMMHFIFLIYLVQRVKGTSHLGTEFIVGFPDFSPYVPSTEKIQLVLCTAHHTDVNVTISDFSTSHSNMSQYVVSPTTMKTITLNITLRVEGYIHSHEGIFIQATHPITVFGLSTSKYTAASFLVLPIHALGRQYYVITWEVDDIKTEFLVIGVENNTILEVTLSGHSHSTGPKIGVTSFSERINRLETFQIQSNNDLSGTHVVADRKIAMISGNNRAVIGSYGFWDHTLEMLPSVDKWGKHFVVTSTPMRSQPDYLKFASSENNTHITLSCGITKYFTIPTAGGTRRKTLQSGSSCEILSDKPLLLVLFTSNQIQRLDKSDPSMVLIPPIEQWGNSYTFGVANNSMFNNHLIIISRGAHISGFLLDGIALPIDLFHQIQATEFYSGFQTISVGVHILDNQSENATFCAYLYGQENYIAYYVPVGFNQNILNKESIATDGTTLHVQSSSQEMHTVSLIREISEISNTTAVNQSSIAATTLTPSDKQSSEKMKTDFIEISSPSAITTGHATSTEGKYETTRHHLSTLQTFSDTSDNSSSCRCCFNSTISTKDLERKLNELRWSLFIPRKSTARYRRSLMSVMDNRPTVIITGSTLGPFILCALALFILLLDIIKFSYKT